MVEAVAAATNSPVGSSGNKSNTSGSRNQTTPDSEKPRVQLELQSSSKAKLNEYMNGQDEQQHLDLLKQTVAQLATT